MTYFAVHLISSSCDHYNMLIKADNPEQFAKSVEANCFDFAYIDDVYVDTEGLPSEARPYIDALREAIAIARENEDE